MMELTRIYHFSAAHRLENRSLGRDANERLYGACYRPHGHNYYLEVTVRGVPDRETGMLVDLGRLDAAVAANVLEHVDHRSLQDVPLLDGVITTGEGLARAFWNRLAGVVPGGGLARVTVVETDKNRFEDRGGEQ